MATLLDIRTKFYGRSGRADMVNASTYANITGVTGGADFFINAGQRMLDEKHTSHRQIQRYPVNFATGQYAALVSGMRTATMVRYVTDEGKKKTLDYVDYDTFTEYFPKLNLLATGDPPINLVDTQSTGTPTIWTMPPTSIIEMWNNEFTAADQNLNKDLDGVFIGDGQYNATAVLIGAPPDRTMQVTIFGRGYSRPLSADTDTSYWSVRDPELLLAAALYKLEEFYSNSEGQSDKMQAILDKLNDLDKDEAEYDSIGVERLEG